MATIARLRPRDDDRAPARQRRRRRVAGLTLIALSAVSFVTIGGLHNQATAAENRIRGMDVSGHQRNVDWNHWWSQGMRFAYVKATEGTGYRNPYFGQQYNGSYQVGMIRGAYHFALPNRSSGRAQANYFVDNGGGWSADGKTLPGALDIEYNPYGSVCYGLSPGAMVDWIRDFSETYRQRTGRYPTIYSTTNWWQTCTGNNGSFGETNALWLARYNSTPGQLPNGWRFHTFWQYSSDPIDQNWFNGSYDRLKVYAEGAEVPPPTSEAPPPPTSASPTEPPPSSSASPSQTPPQTPTAPTGTPTAPPTGTGTGPPTESPTAPPTGPAPTTDPGQTTEPARSSAPPAPPGATSTGLPVTGASSTTAIGTAVALLLAGLGLLYLGRPLRPALAGSRWRSLRELLGRLRPGERSGDPS